VIGDSSDGVPQKHKRFPGPTNEGSLSTSLFGLLADDTNLRVSGT
jgi:hypothetical protein